MLKEKLDGRRGMRRSVACVVAGASAALLAGPALADNSWGSYHWFRTINPIEVKIGDNVSSVWDSYLTGAIADWDVSQVIHPVYASGQTNPKNCKPVGGRIEVCSRSYGFNGWLGMAQIWISDGHITKGVTKLNDSYFNSATYNTPAWRALVTCQEIGHDFGLGHQDADFSTDDTNSCMDYTSVPEGNEHLDQHDYDQLEIIYAHTDFASTSTKPKRGGGRGKAE